MVVRAVRFKHAQTLYSRCVLCTMPPILGTTPPPSADFLEANSSTAHFLAAMREQWRNPSDILSILMIVGGDIVQRAVAQLAGSGPGPFAPVAFSFGWVAYSISMLASTIGEGRLMPPSDCPSILVHAGSGYMRTNKSWVLGRLLRDEEHRLEHEHTSAQTHQGTDSVVPHHSQGRGLTIAFYDVKGGTGLPAKDWVYWAGVSVILLQLIISIIPFFHHANWVVFFVTLIGTILALLGSALPQWRREKYAARFVDKPEVTCLTRGNGAPVAMVFTATRGLRFEDLAGAKNEHCHFTLVATVFLSLLWILLLLTVEGLDGDAWYVFGIGALGMVQNVVAAGARREPDALGFHLEKKPENVVWNGKVMIALQTAEQKVPGVGLALLPIFFPGTLRKEEIEWWDAARRGEYRNTPVVQPPGLPPIIGETSPFAHSSAIGRREASGHYDDSGNRVVNCGFHLLGSSASSVTTMCGSAAPRQGSEDEHSPQQGDIRSTSSISSDRSADRSDSESALSAMSQSRPQPQSPQDQLLCAEGGSQAAHAC
ncbi:hypothetical protein C8Q74DRAFT_364577 [Fomes fomentarius]|nr:hypothetical protein C8Q74DRAFT_364577 [Fomes fomentarius]